MLEPITVPEENRPKPGTVATPAQVEAAAAAAAASAVPLSTYKAKFGEKK